MQLTRTSAQIMKSYQTRFRTFFTEQLNAQQQLPLPLEMAIFVVKAGDGSGKTRVITARMMYLMMEHMIPAAAIVGLTFTNKAAREMQERMKAATSR